MAFTTRATVASDPGSPPPSRAKSTRTEGLPSTVIRAIRCAMAIRDAVRSLGIEVRAGLHTGECGATGWHTVDFAVAET